MKNIRYAFALLLLISIFNIQLKAQLKPGSLVDGIAAVVGGEIILESDIEDQANYAKQQGANTSDRCAFLESIISNKILINEAKKDTLIEKRTDAIKESVNQKYAQIMSQFPDEKAMLAAYKFRTGFEMKNAMEKIDTDQYYMQAKYQRITDKTDVTPAEVSNFFTKYQYQFPQVKDEVTIAEISIFPKLTKAHKQEIIDKLNKIKKDIQGGESFETMARIYSEDPGSASKGGLYSNITRGKMVKPFEAAALNLQEGEISDPVESDFGYHLIQLVKKHGKLYDARHILLKAEPNAEEIATAKKELDSIRTRIIDGKMTFKEAAFKFSDDKKTKFNGGIITNDADGSDKIESLNLPTSIAYHIAGLKKDDITEVFENDLNQKKAVTIVKVEDTIPEHQLSLTTDYDRIKSMALNKAKNDKVEKWIKEKAPGIFISIGDQYKNCKFTEKY